jgi:antitoxin HicB
MLNYPINVLDDTDGFTVQFFDIPEGITYGDTIEEMLSMAVDCLDTAVEFYFDDKRPVPMPSEVEGRYYVSPSPQVEMKILLHNEMLAQNVTKSEMARRLNIAPPNFERVMNVRHKTKFETFYNAFGALGKRLDIRVV